ncbi:unnamed protein product, partial [Citrullus colocynthis]
EKLDGENQVVILLNSFPDKYKEVKSDIRYECDKLTFDIVFDALQSKELDIKIEKKDTEALFVKNKHNKS